MAFFRENLGKLENENEEHMPIGFEVAFPSLLERARGLNIDVPNDSPILKNIFAKRDEKLTRYLFFDFLCENSQGTLVVVIIMFGSCPYLFS
jgi:hypothetical protein